MSDIRQDPRTNLDTDQLAALEELNRQRCRGWWDALGEEPYYPVDSATVCRLLQTVDYLVDHDWLLAAVNERMVPPVPRINGKLAWDATAIVTLTCAAEARRRWKPMSQIHAHKLSLAEKLIQLCEAEGSEAYNDLHRYDLEGLLGILHQVAGDRGAVCVIAEGIRLKLQREGKL